MTTVKGDEAFTIINRAGDEVAGAAAWCVSTCSVIHESFVACIVSVAELQQKDVQTHDGCNEHERYPIPLDPHLSIT